MIFNQEFTSINFIEAGLEVLSVSDIAIETDHDAVLREVGKYARKGWQGKDIITPEARKFEAESHEFSPWKRNVCSGAIE
jgi:hypothetical protein